MWVIEENIEFSLQGLFFDRPKPEKHLNLSMLNHENNERPITVDELVIWILHQAGIFLIEESRIYVLRPPMTMTKN